MREVLLDGRAGSVAELTRALRAALDGSGPAVLPLSTADPESVRAAMAPGEPAEPGTAVIVATSGSTGAPKGVLLSAEALVASATATHDRLGGPGGWLLAMPANHIAGVQVLVRSIVAGREPGVLALADGFRPRAFTEAASDVLAEPGRHYTALVPTQLTRLLADDGDALAALRAFDGVLLGGAATPAVTLERARAAGVAVRTTYGMSETAGGCVYDGVPLAGTRVRIARVQDVKGQRTEALPGAVGLIELAGPMLASGYRLDPATTARMFVGSWFRTNDLGVLGPDGLTVLGRADDVINTGGVKVPSAAVERVLAGAPGVSEVCVVGLPDPEWGQVVAAAVVVSSPVDVAGLGALVRAELGAASVPKVIRVVAELPVRGPGKTDRAAVAALLTP